MAAEVRAAGQLGCISDIPSLNSHRQLGELTSRQWEILIRLLSGERVAMIAKALFISPSTVRNHLSTIFRRFGVHNQSQLIELLRPAFDTENPENVT
jgi:DNA-binding NarL/FixJ family response regulator